MKKTLKTITAIFLATTMLVCLVACGNVTLETKTINSMSLSVPSDFGDFTEKNGLMVAVNDESTASIGISAVSEAEGSKAADIDKETFQQISTSSYSDVKVLEYDNAASIAGNTSIFAHYTAKNSNGVSIETYTYMIFTKNDTFQAVTFTFNMDVDSSLKTNIKAVSSSIKVA